MKHWCMELFSTCTSFQLWINGVKAENWEMIHLKDQMWLKHWAVIQTEGQQRRGWVEARVLWPWNQIDPGADHNIHFQEQIHVFNTSFLLLHWLWGKVQTNSQPESGGCAREPGVNICCERVQNSPKNVSHLQNSSISGFQTLTLVLCNH